MSDKSITIAADKSVQLSAARAGICIEAIWEIDALARVLPGLIHCNDTSSSNAHFAVRGIADRIMRLNGVVLSGISDDMETLKSMHKAVTLKNLEASNV